MAAAEEFAAKDLSQARNMAALFTSTIKVSTQGHRHCWVSRPVPDRRIARPASGGRLTSLDIPSRHVHGVQAVDARSGSIPGDRGGPRGGGLGGGGGGGPRYANIGSFGGSLGGPPAAGSPFRAPPQHSVPAMSMPLGAGGGGGYGMGGLQARTCCHCKQLISPPPRRNPRSVATSQSGCVRVAARGDVAGGRLQGQLRGGGIGGMPAAADGGFGGGMAGGSAVPLGAPGGMAAPAAGPPQRRHYGVEQVRCMSPAGECAT